MRFLLIVVFLLLSGTVTPEQVQIGGVWVESSSLLSETALDETLDRMDRGHFNVINALVFEQGYAFWNSSITEKSPDIEPGFDPLLYLVEESHKRGIQVHTWLIIGPVGLWSGEKGPILSQHPEWALQNPCNSYGSWLDLSQEEVRTFWCDIISEIILNYNVDGVHLDYIRYPGRGWGYNPEFLNEYQKTQKTDKELLLKSSLPLYGFFEGNPLSEVTTAQVLAGFDNGVPAVLINKYGLGTVLLFNWNMTVCETRASQEMMIRSLEFFDKERIYVYYAPETVDVYGYESFASIWEWVKSFKEPHWLEAAWFDPDPDGVVIFPSTYYLDEEAVLKLKTHVKAGGCALFIDGPVFAMDYPELRKIVGMNSVGDYFWGEYSLIPQVEHEIIPLGNTYTVTQYKRAQREWDQFRKDQVTETVEEIHACIGDTVLTAAVFDNKESADSVLQDWYTWMDYLDHVMPMAYVSELQDLEKDLDEWEIVLGSLDKIYPGLSVLTWWPTEKEKSPAEVLKEINLCEKRGCKGVVLFDLGSMDDELLDALAEGPFSQLIRFDYSPPEIGEVSVEVGDVVKISWKTSKLCKTCYYERAYVCDEEFKEYHEIILEDVIPDTEYTVSILVEDMSGNQNREEITFRTLPLPQSPEESVPEEPVPEKSKPLVVLVIPFILVIALLFLLRRKNS